MEDAKVMVADKGGKPTIRQVAEAAGVSVGTASRVLNRNATVKPLVRQKVLKAIEQLGFEPNAIAQSMRSRSTHTIGCILRELNISQLAGFVRAAHNVLDEAGYSLLISNSEGREDRERQLLANLARRQTDGVMIGPYTPIEGEFELFLHGLNMPVVLIDRDEKEWDAVIVDHGEGVRRAVSHLLDIGHRDVALFTGDVRLYPARERLRGFRDAYLERGLVPVENLIQASSFLPDAGFRYTSAMLGQKRPPTAVIAGGIDMLSGVLRAIRGRNLRIPEDISVIGSGYSELAEFYNPPISIIAWDQAEVGLIAANMLLDRVRQTAVMEPRRVVVSCNFLIRDSIAKPRAD